MSETNQVSRVSFVSASFTDEDWPHFEGFAREHFGQSHNRRAEFNRHWFGPDQYGRWNVRKVLRKDTNELSGLMMLIVVDAKFGNQKCPLAWISNAAIVPDAQKAGVGAQLYFWAYKSYRLVGALSGNENSDSINSVIALDIPDTKMERYIFVHRPAEAAGFCLQEFREPVKCFLNQRPPRKETKVSPLKPGSVTTPPPDYDDLWRSFSEKLFFCVDRSREFMAWRYESAPFVKYEYLEFRSGGKLVGFVPIRAQSTPLGEVCRIMDLILCRGYEKEVVGSLCTYLSQSGFIFSDFFLIGTHVSDVLIECGFITPGQHELAKRIPHLLSPIEHREWTNTVNFGGVLAKSDLSWRDPRVIYFTKADSDRDWPTQHDLGNR